MTSTPKIFLFGKGGQVEISPHFLDVIQCTPQQFLNEAKLAMAVKMFEMKCLSSGMAVELIGITRVDFLNQLHNFGVAMLDLDEDELIQNIANV